MKDYKEKRVVQLDKLLTAGLVLEDIEQSKESYSSREYDQAKINLKKILRANRESDREQEQCTKRHQELFNLIPFIGERGTGKTSAMYSFASMLGEYDHTKHQDFLDGMPCGFIVLDPIDASVLKRHENIMLIILSRMVKYLQNVVRQNSRGEYGVPAVRQEELRDLYKRFEDLFQDLNNMEEESPIPRGGSMLQKLLDLNSSYSVAERFHELTDLFLKYMGKNHAAYRYGTACCGGRKQYLVISLDDIDLYRHKNDKSGKGKSVYTLLEQVYEYLQIPGIVVLATYSGRRLKENCVSYIRRKFEDFSEPEKQAEQFLEKVILPQYRIFMPRFYIKDYVSNRQLEIMVPTSGERNIFDVKKPTGFSQKELFLKYLAYYYGTFYDSQGQKTHFWEADTLRRIKNRMNVFWLTNPAEKYSTALGLEEVDQRYMKLISYVYNGLTQELLLDSQEVQLFDRWIRLPIGRRSREIMTYIRTRRRQLDRNENGTNKTEDGYVGNDNRRGYSYGELIQDLYWASRAQLNGKVILSKEMIHCILASYSIVLPYWMGFAEKYDPDGASVKGYLDSEMPEEERLRKEGYENLREVLGTSITGLWANDILYTEFTQMALTGIQRRKLARLGSVSTMFFNEIEFGEINFTAKDISSVSEKLDLGIKIKGATKQEQKIWYFVQIAELMGMMFTNVRETQREEQKYAKRTEYKFVTRQYNEYSFKSNKAERKVTIMPDVSFACYNIFNFVVNSFCWEDYFKDMDDALSHVLWKHFENTLSYPEIEKVVNHYSLRGEFEKWNRLSGSERRLAFPIQHFDMAYNILKHQHNGEDQNLPFSAELEDYLDYCDVVYQNVGNALEQQDEYYKNTSFAETFRTNPFVRYVSKNITECDDMEIDRRGDLSEMLQDALKKVMNQFIDEVSTLENYSRMNVDYFSIPKTQSITNSNIRETTDGEKSTNSGALKNYMNTDPAAILKEESEQKPEESKTESRSGAPASKNSPDNSASAAPVSGKEEHNAPIVEKDEDQLDIFDLKNNDEQTE